MTPPLVELRDVHKEYLHHGKPLEVLHGVSLRIDPGEFVGLVGPSGSGKSTLLALMGLMDEPSSGTVLHGGRDLARAPEAERARERLHTIGYVFQHFYLVPTLTAEENIALPMKAAGLGKAERDARLKRLLEGVALDHRRDHYPHELSGGEQQRVAVARALANMPRLLLADEPTGELDPESGARVMDLLRWAHREFGCAVVLVTHAHDIIPRDARRLRVEAGRLVSPAP
ncbi:MAG TPA: ABC transporter ATP-binding protein [Candidatus Thermoplasmatota archaeon]|nr:ABC transporter ATP-binding protein [Candidatus Thermoplasmatota archaeon]